MACRSGLLALVLVSIPSVSRAETGCVCVGLSLQDRISRADAVFLGHALDQTQSSSVRRGTLLNTIFLIDISWKGPVQDTVSVRSLLTGNCGARFVVGERYVVVAGRDPYGLHQFGCSSALRADRAGAALDILGEPAWSAPEAGQREIDSKPVPAPDSGERVPLSGQITDHHRNSIAGVRIEIADRVATSDSAGGFWIPDLTPGLYLAHLSLPDGSVEEHYVLLRCGQFPWSECNLYTRRFIVEYEVPAVDEPRVQHEPTWPPKVPLDSLDAVLILREAFTALEKSDTLREDEDFKRHFGGLFKKWGVEPPLSLHSPREVLGSLLKADRIDEAISLAGTDRQHLRTIFQYLAETGRWEQALRLSDSLNHADLGVSSVLRASEDAPEWATRGKAVERFILSLADTTDTELMWYDLIDFLALHDPQSAWNLTDLRLAGANRVETQVDLLWPDPERESWPPDSLVLQSYTAVQGLPEVKDRDRLLQYLWRICEYADYMACRELAFPRMEVTPDPGGLADLLSAKLYEGRFEEARVISDSLHGLVSAERHALVVAQGLWKVFRSGPCLLHESCAGVYRSERTLILPELDRVAMETQGFVTDSLNARLAGLWAPFDPERAWEAIRRIESQGSRSDGLATIAEATFETDFELAFTALLERGSAESTGIHLGSTYLDFKSRGNEERAQQTLGLVSSGVDRMRMKLDWAERVTRGDRPAEARGLPLEALEDWDPEKEQMRGARGQFGLFFRLGMSNQLVDWARALEDPDDRAAALAAIVGSVTRW